MGMMLHTPLRSRFHLLSHHHYRHYHSMTPARQTPGARRSAGKVTNKSISNYSTKLKVQTSSTTPFRIVLRLIERDLKAGRAATDITIARAAPEESSQPSTFRTAKADNSEERASANLLPPRVPSSLSSTSNVIKFYLEKNHYRISKS